MVKSIDNMVMENVLGKTEVVEKELDGDKKRRGFYIDSFYVTGMTLNQYRSWAKRQSICWNWNDYIFLQ